MPSLNEANSCCPVCERTDIQARTIDSSVPRKSEGAMEYRGNADDAVHFTCPSCGEFVVTNCDCVNLKSPRGRNEWNAIQLSALIREQSIAKLPPFWLQCGMESYGPIQFGEPLAVISADELLHRWPSSIVERINRAMCNLARLSAHAGQWLTLKLPDSALFFGDNGDEADFILDAVKERGWVKRRSASVECVDCERVEDISLTPNGWARFEELTRGKSSPLNPVFVAMWFGDDVHREEMNDVYEKGILPAIKSAGYKANRVDLVQHNDWIMDKVLGEIRLAPFVVADFTAHRNGVYFEAGFARGLGIPVIHTVRNGELKDAHFDTKQLNHVCWNDPTELNEKLFHRIMGSIGQGPF